MKRVMRLTEGDLVRLVKRVIKENHDESEFNQLIDRLEEESIETNYFGNFDFDSDDVESFSEFISEQATEIIQEKSPNLVVQFINYDTGRAYSLYDKDEEEILFEYRP